MWKHVYSACCMRGFSDEEMLDFRETWPPEYSAGKKKKKKSKLQLFVDSFVRANKSKKPNKD